MASNNMENEWQFNKNVCQRNEHMLDNELAADVVFKVSSSLQGEVRTLRAHTYVLISASPVFWAMFCGDMKEEGDVIVPDVEPEAFRLMLRYIYTDKIELNGTHVMHVLHAAKKYQLSSLVQLCTDYLDKELNAGNACSILEHSMFFNEGALAQKCVQRIERQTQAALSSEDFMNASKETLSTILDSDKLAMEELKLFKRCYEWARNRVQHPESIREALGECLFKIRFPTIPMKEFTDTVCPTGILTGEEQLEILKYMASPNDDSKPRDFISGKRTPSKLISTGDYVKVRQSGRYPASDKCYHTLGALNKLFVIATKDKLATVVISGYVTADIQFDSLEKL